jgi:hypothetical protein
MCFFGSLEARDIMRSNACDHLVMVPTIKGEKRNGRKRISVLSVSDRRRRVVVKQIWKTAVPSAYEVNLLFSILDDTDPVKIALALIGIQMMRPVEVVNGIVWEWMTAGSDGMPAEMRHLIYKPVTRAGRRWDTTDMKETKKPLYSAMLAKWLYKYHLSAAPVRSKIILGGHKLFNWNTPDMLNKFFNTLRNDVSAGKYPPEYNCFLDTCSKVYVEGKERFGGQDNNGKKRIYLYGLRAFALTFHYWVTFKQDIIALAQVSGHTNPNTLLQHYIKPKEAIGLTQKMIDEKITIDQFIQMKGKSQAMISDYEIKPNVLFTACGQKSLTDFAGMDTWSSAIHPEL